MCVAGQRNGEEFLAGNVLYILHEEAVVQGNSPSPGSDSRSVANAKL